MKPPQTGGRTRTTTVFVAGAGHFGSRALRELSRRHPRWRLAVVDRDPRTLVPWVRLGVAVYEGDAVEVLDGLLVEAPPRWVVPAVPFHLAYEWALRRLSQSVHAERNPFPTDLLVPNPICGPSRDLYASFATFRCPEHCPEPPGTCTVTGETRPLPLFRLLRRIQAPGYRITGLRSHQLAPGVGGVQGRGLLDLLSTIQGAAGNYILFTACRCHGVLSGLRVGGPRAPNPPPN